MRQADATKAAAQLAYDLMAKVERDDEGNPLTLEGAVRSVILKCPDRIRYRDDALGTIYCTLGAGIRWREGRLRDNNPNNYMNMPPEAGGQGCWSRDQGREDSFDQMGLDEFTREGIRSRNEEVLRAAFDTVFDIDDRCQRYRPVGSWYPISWYACNLCAPADARPDFYAGAIETIELILHARPVFGTEHWVTHQRTKHCAKEILRALHSQADDVAGSQRTLGFICGA